MDPPQRNWESIWQTLRPGDDFDRCGPAPVLSTFANSSILHNSASLKAFVPGCGRGYDVYFLATHPRFAHVVGLDVSETAIRTAKDYIQAMSPAPSPSRYDLVCGDVFDTSVAPGPFDVAFDNALLCALHPKRWAAWADVYAARLSGGAFLATLMYPIGEQRDDGESPFPVSPEVYAGLLEPLGFECVDGPRELPNAQAPDGRGDGQSVWAVWKRLNKR